MKYIFTFVLISLFSLQLSAQGTLINFNKNNSPLPNNTIRSIAIDHNFVKWFATDFGLASFNDTTWSVYQTTNSCFNTNSFRALAVDDQNRLWAGTFDDGIYIFKDSCHAHYNTSNSPLPDDYIRSLAFDTVGNVWIGTSGGLTLKSDTGWAVFNTNNSLLGSNNISALYATPDNVVLIGTINGGLTVADTGDTWTTYNTQNSNIPDNSILSISVDSLGNYWLGTAAAGLVAYVVSGSSWLVFNPTTSLLDAYTINDVDVNDNGKIFLATIDTGLAIKSNNSFAYIRAGSSDLPDNRLTKVVSESTTVYWIGTINNGVVKLDTAFSVNVFTPMSISNIHIYPNPVSDKFCVDNLNDVPVSADIFDVYGNSHYPILKQFNHGGLCMSVAVPAGIYLLRINTRTGSVLVLKFIVE